MHKPETEWGVAKNEGRSHHLVHVCAKFGEILMFSERNPTSSTSSTPACKRAWYTSSRWSLQTCYTWSYSSRLKENAPLKITYMFISNAKITRGRLLHVSVLPQSHKDDSFKRKATQSNHWSSHQSGEVVWQREGSWPRSPSFKRHNWKYKKNRNDHLLVVLLQSVWQNKHHNSSQWAAGRRANTPMTKFLSHQSGAHNHLEEAADTK